MLSASGFLEYGAEEDIWPQEGRGGRHGEVLTGFWCAELRDHLEDLGVDGRIILKCILQEVKWMSMYWIDLAEDRDR